MSGMVYTEIESPVGRLRLVGDGKALREVWFVEGRHHVAPKKEWKRDERPFAAVIRQLRAYFAGELKKFSVPLSIEGTEFQMRVWSELRKIPYGETRTYGQLAEKIGKPHASRAVGLANGQNPIPIIVPCHRVIGSNGNLTGFGGGIENKKKLLELESGQWRLL